MTPPPHLWLHPLSYDSTHSSMIPPIQLWLHPLTCDSILSPVTPPTLLCSAHPTMTLCTQPWPCLIPLRRKPVLSSHLMLLTRTASQVTGLHLSGSSCAVATSIAWSSTGSCQSPGTGTARGRAGSLFPWCPLPVGCNNEFLLVCYGLLNFRKSVEPSLWLTTLIHTIVLQTAIVDTGEWLRRRRFPIDTRCMLTLHVRGFTRME